MRLNYFCFSRKQIASSKQLYAIAVAHCTQNFGLYINLAWLPSYFNQKYGLSVDQSSFFSVGPWVGGAVLGSMAGYLADIGVSNNIDKTLIRRFAQSFALVIPACILTLLSVTSATDLNPTLASTYFIIATASAAVCVAGFGSSIQDICKSPKLTPILYGITSIPAVLMGSFGVYLTGLILDNFHDWNIIFRGVAFIYCVGALYYSTNYEAKKTFE